MSFLQKELVSKYSPNYIGFIYVVSTIFLSILLFLPINSGGAMLCFSVFQFPEPICGLFNFWYPGFWSGLFVLALPLFVAMNITARKNDFHGVNTDRILFASTKWFAAFWLLLLLPDIESTSFQEIVQAILMLLFFFITSKYLFSKRT